MLTAPVAELEKYAKEFPSETAMCLLHLMKKSELADAQAVGGVVKHLEAHGKPAIGRAGGAIREALAERGLVLDGGE